MVELRFRPLTREDLGLLGRWLAADHVEPWWQEDPSPAAVEARYGPAVDGREPTDLRIVEVDGEPIGFIQRYRLVDDPDWQESLRVAGTPEDAAGCDYLIGDPGRLGAGLGPRLIDAFVAELWDRYPEVPAVVVDVDPRNRRSWRALEKVGFERVYEGHLESEDPADCGPTYVYLLRRPDATAVG